jgi:hypothetical protein
MFAGRASNPTTSPLSKSAEDDCRASIRARQASATPRADPDRAADAGLLGRLRRAHRDLRRAHREPSGQRRHLCVARGRRGRHRGVHNGSLLRRNFPLRRLRRCGRGRVLTRDVPDDAPARAASTPTPRREDGRPPLVRSSHSRGRRSPHLVVSEVARPRARDRHR